MHNNTLLVGCGKGQIKRINRYVTRAIPENYLKGSKRKRSGNFYLLEDINDLQFVDKNYTNIVVEVRK